MEEELQQESSYHKAKERIEKAKSSGEKSLDFSDLFSNDTDSAEQIVELLMQIQEDIPDLKEIRFKQ